jgi:hypothetical protein
MVKTTKQYQILPNVGEMRIFAIHIWLQHPKPAAGMSTIGAPQVANFMQLKNCPLLIIHI